MCYYYISSKCNLLRYYSNYSDKPSKNVSNVVTLFHEKVSFTLGHAKNYSELYFWKAQKFLNFAFHKVIQLLHSSRFGGLKTHKKTAVILTFYFCHLNDEVKWFQSLKNFCFFFVENTIFTVPKHKILLIKSEKKSVNNVPIHKWSNRTCWTVWPGYISQNTVCYPKEELYK